MKKKSYLLGMLTGFLITAFIAVGVFCGKMIYDKKHDEEVKPAKAKSEYIFSDPEVTDKVVLLEDTIDKYFIDDVSDEDLKNGVYSGVVDAINDPYAKYYTPEELEKLKQDTAGIYYGIGVYLQKDTTTLYPRATGIIENSPASEVDIQVDDYIYKVNGQEVYDMDLTDVVMLIKGEEGTKVNLTLYRQSISDYVDVTVERRKVETPTVKFKMLDDDVAYIQITEFDSVTVRQFEEAMAQARGANMKGLVLDLRGNPGGSVAAVVDIANQILPKGLVVYTEDKYGTREEYKSDGKHELDVPMVVLVNGGSASSSEILSGAIKDYGKGTLMGTTTYGKGIVQRIVPFKDGSAIKLTVSHYYTPLGNDIHKVGIEPDVVIEFDSERYLKNQDDDNQLKAAHEYVLKEIK